MASTILGRVSISPRGTWTNGLHYYRLDVVNTTNSSYMCIQDNINIPLSNTSYWMIIGKEGRDGRSIIVLPNGNFGNWDEATSSYIDSGVVASAIVDIDNSAPTFTQASIRANIESGESIQTIFGKIKKWFADFGSLAWKNTVNYTTDIINLPSIPTNTSDLTNGAGFINSTQANGLISVHDSNPLSHDDIRVSINTVAQNTDQLITDAKDAISLDINSALAPINSDITSLWVSSNTNANNISNNRLNIDNLNTRVTDNEIDIYNLQLVDHFRGYFKNITEIEALTNVAEGDFAWSAETGTVWQFDGTNWVDTLVIVPDQVIPASDSLPLMNGTAEAGISTDYSRGDHKHPIDTTRASFEELTNHNESRNSHLALRSIDKYTTILVADWSLQDGSYNAIIYDSDVLELSKVSAMPADSESYDMFASAIVFSGTSSAGQLLLRAQNVPSGDMNINYTISI